MLKSKQNFCVLIDTVVDELAKDPNKRFVYVEIAYFWRWWNEQNDEIKQLVRTLVDEGRLEFVIGAWYLVYLILILIFVVFFCRINLKRKF